MLFRSFSVVKPTQQSISHLRDTDYEAAASTTSRLIDRQKSLLRWVSPAFYRDTKLIREWICSRGWAKDGSAGQVFHQIAKRASSAAACEPALQSVGRWLQEVEASSLITAIRVRKAATARIRRLNDYLNRLPILLRYLATIRGLDQWSQEAVRAMESAPGGSPKNWAKVVELSALLAWVGQIEKESPILRHLTPELYESNRSRLIELVQQKRRLESQAIRSRWASRWSDIDHRWRRGLRFRGPRSQRLREIVQTGCTHGLFELRPCWLVNSGTASQVFPLTPALFDVVIFDEASQCPPEYALPSLFRGRRAVVAGDGKQLPPTMFFKTAFDFDTEESDDQESVENRVDFEISTGSEDLLSLARARLPDAHLNVHYRSLDPVLIAFSNAAFYRNRLEAPQTAMTVTPDGAPALCLERVDGVYLTNRTNPDEARQVVAYLKQL